MIEILCIAGPTASGKSARAVEEALARGGEAPHQPGWCGAEIISVDSRQVYRGLDIGTEKITKEEMRGVPHHLIDILEANEVYSAGDFVADATILIAEISMRGKLPILVGGTHFYFDALSRPIAEVDANPALRAEFEKLSTHVLYTRGRSSHARRATEIDPHNRRRLIRALEIIESLGHVPPRGLPTPLSDTRFHLVKYDVRWVAIDPPKEELRARIDARLKQALGRGLVDEVRNVREKFGDARLNELGLEYKIVGEFLRDERAESSILPALSAKLWQLARHQKAWLRKLSLVGSSHQDRS